ncbi:MAG: FAD-dependent oxidoreductase [Eubacteriales bacterium]
MVNITINNKSLIVPEDKNILECALDAGIYIPHLCHHPNLKDIGACKMCIVEVEGEDGLVSSCTLYPKDGMVITTESQNILKKRNMSMELLLAGHPEECTTCPKYGKCELQSLTQYIDAGNARLHHRSKGMKLEEENPLIVHDMNRCVLCGRCVRACSELRGVGILDYMKKGDEVYIGTVESKSLKDADCRFCTACVEVCPTGAIRDKLSLMDSGEKKEDALVPCRYECPAHTNIPLYVRYVKEGKYDEAAAVIREKLPFPKSLGYICNHSCELGCKRNEVSEPIAIRDIKRFAAENDTGKYWREKGKQLPDTGKKVCVVGGGPAGLTGAYYLRKQGHDVTIKEAREEVGGMLRYGIPSYRLPNEIVAEEAGYLLNTGIKLESNTMVKDPVGLLNEYDAVLITIGTHNGVKLPLEGNDLKGVLLNIDFLRNASMGQETGMGKKVVVLGGGNVAFDCARTAKRLGAEEVTVACLESRDTMPADEEEIEQAKEEGIAVHPARAFEKLNGTGVVENIDLMEVDKFYFDENRRAVIEKREGSEYSIEADTIIFAVGQRPGFTEEMGLSIGHGNRIIVNDKMADESHKGIFAAGDAVTGTQSVVKAVASARAACSEIDKYLGGDGDISEKLAPDYEYNDEIGKIEGFGYLTREKEDIMEADKRKGCFDLVNKGIGCGAINDEASRCLQCDLRLRIKEPRLWNEYSTGKGDEE